MLEDKKNISQKDNLRAVIFQGHACNSQTRGVEMKKALEKLDMVVISDPYPTHMAVMSDRKNDTYLLPTSTQYETCGTATASNRALQWRDKIIEPVYESLPDHVILYKLAKKLGFAKEMFKNIKVTNDEPLIEDVLREINRGAWTIGYTGQSPERLKLHAKHRGTFNTLTLRAEGGPCKGDYYGLPWPCWGKPEMKHPGTPILYDPSKPVAEGGLVFRAAWGPDYNGVSLLAADGVYSKGSEIKDGYPEFTSDILKKLGWWDELTPDEKKAAEGKNWKTDLSGGIQRVVIKHGCAPFGNGRARCNVWTYPDPIPIHREPLYTPQVRPREKISDLSGPQGILAAADPLPVDPVGQPQRKISAGLHQRPPGRIRRRRRGRALRSVAGQAAAGDVRGDQPEGRGGCRHLQRPVYLAGRRGGRQDQGARHGHQTGGSGNGLDAVPFRRLVPGQGPLRQIPGRHCALCPRRGVQHGHHLWIRFRDPDAGNQSNALPDIAGVKRRQIMARMKFLCDAERCIDCNGCVTACNNEHDVPWGINRRHVVTMK